VSYIEKEKSHIDFDLIKRQREWFEIFQTMLLMSTSNHIKNDLVCKYQQVLK
jgi:hypothetical protein